MAGVRSEYGALAEVGVGRVRVAGACDECCGSWCAGLFLMVFFGRLAWMALLCPSESAGGAACTIGSNCVRYSGAAGGLAEVAGDGGCSEASGHAACGAAPSLSLEIDSTDS
eukprot:6087379-Alexandrium_andersonii.AAC.1